MKLSFFVLCPFILFSINSQAQLELDIDDIQIEESNRPYDSNHIYHSWDVNKEAVFLGGRDEVYQFIAKNLTFPYDYKHSEDSSVVEDLLLRGKLRVTVGFVIETDSTISSIKVMDDNGEDYMDPFIREAVRVIKMTSGMWTPAMQRGTPVRQQLYFPIKFLVQ